MNMARFESDMARNELRMQELQDRNLQQMTSLSDSVGNLQMTSSEIANQISSQLSLLPQPPSASGGTFSTLVPDSRYESFNERLNRPRNARPHSSIPLDLEAGTPSIRSPATL